MLASAGLFTLATVAMATAAAARVLSCYGLVRHSLPRWCWHVVVL